jgi:hypothetical protein
MVESTPENKKLPPTAATADDGQAVPEIQATDKKLEQPAAAKKITAAESDADKKQTEELLKQLQAAEANKAPDEPIKRKEPEPEVAPPPSEPVISAEEMARLQAAAASQSVSNASSVQEETLERAPAPEKPAPAKDDKFTKTLIMLGVIAAVAVGGALLGYFLLTATPLSGVVAGAINSVGLMGAHIGAFLQGVGILSVPSVTTAATAATLPAGAGVAAGVIGGAGATFVAMKSNFMHMMGLDSVSASTTTTAASSMTGHETAGMDHGSQAVATKLASKTSQYASEHEELTTREHKSWADRTAGSNSFRDRLQSTGSHAEAVGRKASGGNFAEELREARELKAMLGEQATAR